MARLKNRAPRGVRRLLRALLGADVGDAAQSFTALTLSGMASLVAGLTLASATGRLEAFPGLLLLVPAAIGLRGNIFGALGSRLGTTIHTGTFTLARRFDTVVGQNVLAAACLTITMSVALAALAKLASIAFDLPGTMSLADFVAISLTGGVLASLIVLVITLALAAVAERQAWDLDNVVAPLITAVGDVVTVPALVLATLVAGQGWVTPSLAIVAGVLAAISMVAALRSGLDEMSRIVKESLPVLAVAGSMDLIAGITIEKRLDAFKVLPALLILLPGYLETAGALGGILSSRLSTKFHLGLVEPTTLPGRLARRDLIQVATLALPAFTILGVVAHLGGLLTDHAGPGLVDMLLVSVLGGILSTLAVVVVAYYGTMGAMRLGADPDTYGIPLVTATLDFVGVFSFIFVAVGLGVV